MRRLLPVLCGALAFAAPGAAASQAVDRGLVMRVHPPRLVLRELDGSRVRFAINRSTDITLDGRHVRLAQLHRGDVALVLHNAQIVIAVKAFRP